MAGGSNRASSDRNEIALNKWDARMGAALRPLISKKIIAEHKRNPLGHHSDALSRVLNYIRRRSPLGKSVVVCTRPFKEWRLARLPEVRGRIPLFVDERVFDSEEKATHALFLMRIEELIHE